MLIQLIGGNFQDVFGTRVADGYLELVLIQGGSQLGALAEFYPILSPVSLTPICLGATFIVPLDSDGNVVASPAFSVYANDTIVPINSYYQVTCFDSRGQKLWGPNSQQILSSLSPLSTTWDCGQWVPNQIQEI